ncbi:uncharacterized protein SAPINGB_P005795 [Magnusiomyces paraingens]|uniref:Replication protein A C-terminal domain-containing protein n=1 Tax=Magnusiomyces paraingens TaxID=2606893 RepID=A0A5E8C6X7_9ASCO|nr:uncharacterized protein SAPINGB_P005795 [Saprochaete ingens]VVT57638.1 unnamed protein product [Saprochaete ingens]
MSYEGGYFDNAGTSSSQPNPEVDRSAERAIRTVTVHQLLKAHTETPMDDVLELDNHPIKHVRFVARIIWKSEPYATNQQFRFEDGTGIISGKVLFKNDLSTAAPDDFDEAFSTDGGLNKKNTEKTEKYQLDFYYSIMASITRFNNSNSLTVNHMQPVTDFSQVAFSQLKAIREHIHFTKRQKKNGNNQGSNQPKQHGNNDLFVSGGGAGAGVDSSSASLASRIKTLLSSQQSPDGLHQDIIVAKVGGNKPAVEQVLRELIDQGDLYEVGDNHFALV